MSHLKKMRKGWENEHLSRYLLSRISFLSQPITVADDLGVDFMCTLFRTIKVGKEEQLVPHQSFSIQVKTTRKAFRGDKQLNYLRNLEVPFFIGLVTQDRSGLDIYSGEILPDFFSWAPAEVSFILSPQQDAITHAHDGAWPTNKKGIFVLPCPYIGTLKVMDSPEDSGRISSALAAICSTTIRNIAAKLSEEYVFRYPSADGKVAYFRIQAGTGSINTFRGNFMLRLAEVFYNLRRIADIYPQQFSIIEFDLFEKEFLQLQSWSFPHADFVGNIYNDLSRTIQRRLQIRLLEILRRRQGQNGSGCGNCSPVSLARSTGRREPPEPELGLSSG